jgi:hypothetical protein
MKGFFLFLIAIILYLPLTFLNWLAVCFKYGLNNDYFKQTAIHIDVFGNMNLRTLLNYTLITKNSSFKFGDKQVTISATLGYNQYYKTLTKTGKIICFILDTIDKKHCYKAAKYYGLF